MKCITHHHACDCREKKFMDLRTAAAALQTMLTDGTLGDSIGGCDDQKNIRAAQDRIIDGIKRMNSALEALE